MTLTGEDGITLDDIWAEVPMNYKSVALPHMPNFFLVNGPFSPGGSASVLSIIETHVGYVTQLIDRAVADRVALEPTPTAAPSSSPRSASGPRGPWGAAAAPAGTSTRTACHWSDLPLEIGDV